MADLTTPALVKAYANVTESGDDSAISGIIAAVSGMIHGVIGHDFDGTLVVAEHHSAPLSGAIVTRKPVATIQAVRENGATLAASGYELQSGRLVYRLGNGQTISWGSGLRSIEIDYTPPVDVPADLELAAREVSAFMLKQSALTAGGGRLGLSAQANGDTGSADYFVQALSKLPMSAVVLKRYQAFV